MILDAIGFTNYDWTLLGACTLGGLIGSIAHAISASIHPDGPPNKEGVTHLASPDLQEARGIWFSLRLMLGGILGFVFGLYFVGTLHETPATFAKVWALSFIVGYAAPKIWTTKEQALLRKVSATTLHQPEK